jgi:hypothetical protein
MKEGVDHLSLVTTIENYLENDNMIGTMAKQNLDELQIA